LQFRFNGVPELEVLFGLRRPWQAQLGSKGLLRNDLLERIKDFLPGKVIDHLGGVHLGKLGNYSHRVTSVPGRNLLGKAFKFLLVVFPLSHPPGRGGVRFLEPPVADEGIVQDVESVACYEHLVGLEEVIPSLFEALFHFVNLTLVFSIALFTHFHFT
jgi:hypothetical protein